jgi:hypothetical protein
MRVAGNFDFSAGSGAVNTGPRCALTSAFNPTFVSRRRTHSSPVDDSNTTTDESFLTITKSLAATADFEICALLFLNPLSVNANSMVFGNLTNTARFGLIRPGREPREFELRHVQRNGAGAGAAA